MSSEEDILISFGCYDGGKFEEVDGKDLYNGGGYMIMEACPSRLFPKLMNQLPIRDESRAENEREEAERDETERYEADSEAEGYEAERNEHQFDEEARVERNVSEFVDEDFDEYATPLCSDEDEDGVERDGYLRTPWAIKGCEEFKDDYDPGDDGEHESAMGVGAVDTEGAADDDDMADIRELHDEDFISDAEEEDFAGTNLESDEDQVPNMYGEEEYDD
ncbi:hypothetical protein F2Q70_00025376 [Brassica cretica]|uniref:Uncharacterized protein n=4 Tax=Brassica TaxID=3705 RepID=A0A8S9L6Q4_BRACR|nr:hypothetical protein F2Q70_00025376 [Brassica cretica]